MDVISQLGCELNSALSSLALAEEQEIQRIKNKYKATRTRLEQEHQRKCQLIQSTPIYTQIAPIPKAYSLFQHYITTTCKARLVSKKGLLCIKVDNNPIYLDKYRKNSTIAYVENKYLIVESRTDRWTKLHLVDYSNKSLVSTTTVPENTQLVYRIANGKIEYDIITTAIYIKTFPTTILTSEIAIKCKGPWLYHDCLMHHYYERIIVHLPEPIITIPSYHHDNGIVVDIGNTVLLNDL